MKFRTSRTTRLSFTFLFGAALAFTAGYRDASGADPNKTLRVEFRVAESGFDPQAVGDSYSFHVINAIFDPPYTYDYFARPVRLVPNTAAALPQISDDGRTYTFRIKPGIHFADHAAFNGKKRELVAADYVFSIKRMFDPKVRSYWLYLFEHNLLGLDATLAVARKTGRFDYDAPLEGLQALDRYTLRIKFKHPDYAFQHWLTTGQFGAVAREVVDLHRDDSNRVMEHPVGTGPYLLKAWTRGQKIVLAANPHYRVETYPGESSATAPDDAAMAKDFANRTLPLVGNVEISILEEAQPRLLTFERGELDYLELPASLAGNVLADDVLKPAFAQRGIRLHRQVEPSLSFTFFNMDNGIVGGYSKEKIALRRAISLGYDRATGIRLLLNGQALPATQPVPPGVPGYDPALAESKPYDPAAARALLDQFGYRDRDGDGYRELPDGKPLTIVRASTPDAAARDADELWKRSMDAIGIRMTTFKQKWPELNKMSEAGQLMMWGLAWITSIPDGDSFFATLYSKNIGSQNDARLRLAEYDRLYEEVRALPEGPARAAIYRKLTRLVLNYAPWLMQNYPYDNVLTQPWLKGYKQHPYLRHQWKYYDVGQRH